MPRPMEQRRGPIDWERARERLARTAIDRESRARGREVLERRARALAAPPVGAPPPVVKCVALQAATERYAIPATHVVRVERVTVWARLPGAERFVLGLVPVGGRAYPLVDLPTLLGTGAPSPGMRWAVVLGAGQARFAVAAETVSLEELPVDDIQRAPFDPEGVRRGVCADARLVLDPGPLLELVAARLRPAEAPR